MRVTKAVIPAAGRGSRLGDLTLTQPKELLPIGDKVAIDYVIEEAIAVGIEEVCLITSADKILFFEKHLRKYLIKIDYIIQQKPLGLAHAVNLTRDWVNEDNFFLMLPDEIYPEFRDSKKLLSIFYESGGCVIALFPILPSQAYNYGIPELVSNGEKLEIVEIIEKPQVSVAKFNRAVSGRYLFNDKIWEFIGKVEVSQNGEMELSTALNNLARYESILGYLITGERFDIGSKKGWLEANFLAGKRKYGDLWVNSLLNKKLLE